MANSNRRPQEYVSRILANPALSAATQSRLQPAMPTLQTPPQQQRRSILDERNRLFNRRQPASSRTPETGRNVRRPSSASGKEAKVITKDVYLLDSYIQTMPRGAEKALLHERKQVIVAFKIEGYLEEDSLYERLEEHFKFIIDQSKPSPRFEYVKYVGGQLVKPTLDGNTKLDSATVLSICKQGDIYLRATSSLKLGNDNNLNSPGDPSDPEVESQIKKGAEEDSTNETDDYSVFLADMFPSASSACIGHVVKNTICLEDAVDMMVNADGLGTVKKVLETVRNLHLNTNEEIVLKVSREMLWEDCLKFYKSADRKTLTKKLVINFIGEDGIDHGAVKNEFFSLVLKRLKSELFETYDKEPWLCAPKRSGGNFHIFKMAGVIIGHSLLQSGPYFNFLAPWVVEILCNGNVSGQISLECIPVNQATGLTVTLIKQLQHCNSDDDIAKIFDSPDSNGYEQIIGLSEWDQNIDITMENHMILVDMLIYEEVINRRSGKVKAIKEGMKTLGFDDYLHLPIMKDLFTGKQQKVSGSKLINQIVWPSPEEGRRAQAVNFFKSFIETSDENTLINLLKFTTGIPDLTPLIDAEQFIDINYLDGEVLPKSSACYKVIHLPCGNSNQTEFNRRMESALEIESEGYGEY